MTQTIAPTPSAPLTVVKPTEPPSDYQAPAILLIGETGTGKTDALTTIVEAGLDLFVIVTEPVGLDSLLDAMARRNLPMSKLHYTTVTPTLRSYAALEQIAKTVSIGDYESLSKLKPTGGRNNSQWFKLLARMRNFTCSHCGEQFGDVSTWDDTRCIAIDSLSGLNIMATDLVKGEKPLMHQGEWSVAMNMIEQLLQTCSASSKCMFVLTSHIDRETNEITGGSNIYAAALGKKLGPKLPRFFSEVVMSYQEQGNFYWKTQDSVAALKRRALPFGQKIEPSYRPIIDAHKRRLAQLSGSK